MTLDDIRRFIPAELMELEQWVAWRAEPGDEEGDKPRKIPINPRTGNRAASTKGGTWGRIDSALQRAAADGLAGIGFVFTVDDPYVGIDLDKCREPKTGEIAPWAQAIVEQLDSYTEVSPSGTGIHVIVRGTLPAGRRRKGHVEMYDRGRYFTVTGDRMPGTRATIEERQEQIDALHARVFETDHSQPTEPTGHFEPASAPPSSGTPSTNDDEVIEKALAAKNGTRFQRLWEGDHSAYVSQSEADLALCGLLAFWTRGDTDQIDRLFRRSGLMRDKWDKLRGGTTYGANTIEKALAGKAEFYSPPASPSERDGGSGGRESADDNQATLLIRIVIKSGAELYHDARGESFATIRVNQHHETHRIGSRTFQRWVSRLAYRHLKKAVGSSVLADAIMCLEGRALFDGPEQAVHVRLAGHDRTIYLDLGRPEWDAVAIAQTGWSICSNPPVRFRRPAGFGALAMPVRGGDISRLRAFVNVSDSDWPLILGWLVAALRPRGPYPILGLTGEHGSAKSTTGRSVRRLVDPNAAPLRAQPRDTRDIMIAASNSWVLGFDNLSSLPPGLSDALCMISTGGGFATRTLFTDDDETLFDVQRPMLTTSIEDILGRADLLDRTLLCQLPGIEDKDRRDEAELLQRFADEWPGMLGALLDAVVTGLRNFNGVKLDRLPRMADFAKWVTACEPGLGLTPGTFMKAYAGNREAAVEVALESDLVAQAVTALINDEPDEIVTTAMGLLHRLNGRRGDGKPPKGWPGTPKGLGTALRRLAPNLRAAGYEVSFWREPKTRRRLIRVALAKSGPDPCGPTGPNVPPCPRDGSGDRGLVSERDMPPSDPNVPPGSPRGPVGTVGTHPPEPSLPAADGNELLPGDLFARRPPGEAFDDDDGPGCSAAGGA